LVSFSEQQCRNLSWRWELYYDAIRDEHYYENIGQNPEEIIEVENQQNVFIVP